MFLQLNKCCLIKGKAPNYYTEPITKLRMFSRFKVGAYQVHSKLHILGMPNSVKVHKCSTVEKET